MMKEQVFAQAALMAGELDERQQMLLRLLCEGALSGILARLREDVWPEDCREVLIMAASFYALADLQRAQEAGLAEFRAGDLTVKQGSSQAGGAEALQRQAERLIKPYLKDSFTFLGV